jgi:peptidoglycan/LPS O-acetylase OafA/YrhL
MVQAWNPFNPGYAGAWNAVCWSLSVEAFFYLVFPFAQTSIERHPPRRLAFIAIVLLAFAIAANTAARTLGDPTYPGIFRFIPLPLIHLPEFLIGVTLGNLFLERNVLPATTPRLSLITLAGVLITLLTLCLPSTHFTSFVLLGFALLLYGLAAERTLLSRLLSTRALLLGGAISYSLYLLQTPVRTWIKSAFAATHHADGLANMAAVVLTLIPAALLSFFLVEEPSRKLLRRLFSRTSAPRTA